MKYRYAEFLADFPDDHEENERDILLFGGRLAAEAIAEMLRGLGYVVEAPEYMGDHGWDINVYVDGKRIWLELVRLTNEYILQIEALPGLFERLFRRPDLSYYAEFLTKLNEGLARDPRFEPLQWYALVDHNPKGEPMAEPPSVL
jgi:hypothetical protein